MKHNLTQLETEALNLFTALKDSMDTIPKDITLRGKDNETYNLYEVLEVFVENVRN